jgi:hypothetical protein
MFCKETWTRGKIEANSTIKNFCLRLFIPLLELPPLLQYATVDSCFVLLQKKAKQGDEGRSAWNGWNTDTDDIPNTIETKKV